MTAGTSLFFWLHYRAQPTSWSKSEILVLLPLLTLSNLTLMSHKVHSIFPIYSICNEICEIKFMQSSGHHIFFQVERAEESGTFVLFQQGQSLWTPDSLPPSDSLSHLPLSPVQCSFSSSSCWSTVGSWLTVCYFLFWRW